MAVIKMHLEAIEARAHVCVCVCVKERQRCKETEMRRGSEVRSSMLHEGPGWKKCKGGIAIEMTERGTLSDNAGGGGRGRGGGGGGR